MTKKPEAIQLAEAFENCTEQSQIDREAAAELRRQHALIEELRTALRIHHDWSKINSKGYHNHGLDAVAYRATAAVLAKAEDQQ